MKLIAMGVLALSTLVTNCVPKCDPKPPTPTTTTTTSTTVAP